MNEKELLIEVLAHAGKNASLYAEMLFNRYGSLSKIAEADVASLTNALSGDSKIASYIRIAFVLVSRRITDSFKFGVKHTEEELEKYLCALLFVAAVETVYLVSFDGAGRVIACDYIGEGTVNYMNVFPRKIVEAASKRKAVSAIVAHNHPGGYAEPSDDDIKATKFLHGLFVASGIRFLGHYIIGDGVCRAMDIKELADF